MYERLSAFVRSPANERGDVPSTGRQPLDTQSGPFAEVHL